MLRSERLYRKARTLMPGGVSSPVRAYDPYPRFMRSGRGSRIIDVDGREYVDYCLGYGPLILGHAPPPVVRAVRRAVERGSIFGAPTEGEILLAERIRRHYPAAERVRFVNTGTEATMHAIRLARGFTGRRKVIKVEGGYHGAHDSVLVHAGSGSLAHGLAGSPGVLAETAAQTLVVPYNDPGAVEAAIRGARGDVAALILEPVLGNTGLVLPEEGYLEKVREATERHGVLLILDEVITGFRLGLGGAQERFGIRPDLFTLGKIVGGGHPIGVLAGRREVMEMLAPSGKVYQAGTFSGNPVSVAAGLATVRELERRGYRTLDRRSAKLVAGLEDLLSRRRLEAQVVSLGSMFQLFFTNVPIRNLADVRTASRARFMAMFHRLLDAGVYLPPSPFETNFLSLAHTEPDLHATLAAFEGAVRGLR